MLHSAPRGHGCRFAPPAPLEPGVGDRRGGNLRIDAARRDMGIDEGFHLLGHAEQVQGGIPDTGWRRPCR